MLINEIEPLTQLTEQKNYDKKEYNDLQNTHNSGVVGTLRKSYNNLKSEQPGNFTNKDIVKEIEEYIEKFLKN